MEREQMINTIEDDMKKRYSEDNLKDPYDYMMGAITALEAVGVEIPISWSINIMCGRIDRIYAPMPTRTVVVE